MITQDLMTQGVLAGVPFFDQVFESLGCTVEWLIEEGESFTLPPSGRVQIAIVKGRARHLLLGERPALNALARASGIATRARRLQKLKEESGWTGVIAGTRKTTPGNAITNAH